VAAARPRAAVIEKEHLTEKEIMSSTFYTLEQVTGLGVLGLRILYETSGAETFEEFAYALLTAQNLRLDRTLVLRSLYQNRLEETLQQFGFTEEQAEKAIDQAKEQLKMDKKAWDKRS
jgi:Holliday junction resolvasome RuvABC DNA-binding subunit